MIDYDIDNDYERPNEQTTSKVIVLYKKQKNTEDTWKFAISPKCLKDEIILEKQLFELPINYKTQVLIGSDDMEVSHIIDCNGKMKSLHTDQYKQLPYIIEYKFNFILNTQPQSLPIYLIPLT